MKDSKTIKIILFIILAFGVSSLIVSCGDFVRTPTSSNRSNTPEFFEESETYIPNDEMVNGLPANTITAIPSSTPMPVANPTHTADNYVKEECLDISATLPSDIKMEGVIVLKEYLENYIYLGRSDVFLYNLTTQKKETLPMLLENRRSVSVSPDRLKIAQQFGNTKRDREILVISDSSGTVQKQISLVKDFYYYNWVNNRQVFLRLYDDYGGLVWVIINTETEDQLFFPVAELPYYQVVNTVGNQIFFDPTLERIVYPSGFILHLFDWTERRELGYFGGRTAGPIDADWKLDGSQVAIVSNGWIDPNTPFEPIDDSNIPDEIFIVDREGGIVQTTHLGDYYDVDSTPYGPRWSPDGRYIATWLYAKTGDRLVLIDTIDQKVVDFCISSQYEYLDLPAPIWSPDSKQILVEDRSGNNGLNQVIIIDIAKKAAIQIAENERPMGWMIATP